MRNSWFINGHSCVPTVASGKAERVLKKTDTNSRNDRNLSVISVQPDLKSGCGEYQDFQSASPCFSALQMLIFAAVGLQIRPNGQFVSLFF